MPPMNVTNTSQSPLGLPNGTIVDPKRTVLVKDWDKVESNEVVKGWVDAGALTLEPADEEKANDTGLNVAGNDTNGNDGGNGTGTLFVAKTDAELDAMNNGERASYIEKTLGGQVKSGATKDDLTKQIKDLEAAKLAANPAA